MLQGFPTHGTTKKTFPSCICTAFCCVGFVRASQPLMQTAKASGELVRKCQSQNLEMIFSGAL